MAMTSGEIKAAFETVPKATSQMFGRMLRDFGYSNATDEAVEKEMRSLLEGNEPCNLSYGLWLQTWLRDGVD